MISSNYLGPVFYYWARGIESLTLRKDERGCANAHPLLFLSVPLGSKKLSLSRHLVITLLRHRLCPIAFRIIAATPELLAGVDSFLGHALNHRLSA